MRHEPVITTNLIFKHFENTASDRAKEGHAPFYRYFTTAFENLSSVHVISRINKDVLS